jgi:hypothetical protein
LVAQLLSFLATDQFDHKVTRLFDVVIGALVILAPLGFPYGRILASPQLRLAGIAEACFRRSATEDAFINKNRARQFARSSRAFDSVPPGVSAFPP